MLTIARSFYDRDTIIVAQELLGKYLVHDHDGIQQIGSIVEVEAYLGAHDLACHAAKGLSPRTQIMFGPPGYAYVYLIYGMYHCMNVVTEKKGHASAVLIRALQPIKNITLATNGPGRLCKAMAIDKKLNGHDLLSKDFFICEPFQSETFKISKRPRIGIDYAGYWAKRLLRFYISNNPYVSKK